MQIGARFSKDILDIALSTELVIRFSNVLNSFSIIVAGTGLPQQLFAQRHVQAADGVTLPMILFLFSVLTFTLITALLYSRISSSHAFRQYFRIRVLF